jgi:hypothetical protein
MSVRVPEWFVVPKPDCSEADFGATCRLGKRPRPDPLHHHRLRPPHPRRPRHPKNPKNA